MISNFRHAGIVVPDLDMAIDFYGRVLGFQILRKMDEGGAYLETLMGIPGIRATTVKMGLGDRHEPKPIIELLFFHQASVSAPKRRLDELGLTHIALTVNNLDELYNRLVAERVEFVSLPQLSEDGSAKVVFARAPEGTYLELVELLRP